MATTYKVKQWKNTNYYGKVAQSKKAGTMVYFFNAAGEFGILYPLATANLIIGVASGRAVEMTNGITYYLITLKTPYQGNAFAYVSIQDFYFLTGKAADEKAAKDDAQKTLNALVASDKKLVVQILQTQLVLAKLKAAGKNIYADQAKLMSIVDAFQRRQIAIKTNPLISIVSMFKISGIGCAHKRNCGCTKNAVGFVPLLIPIAIGAGTVLAGFAMYYFLKPEYNTSQLHSEYLTKNEAELKAKLGDKAYAELKQNVDQEIKDEAANAYGEGKSESTFGWIKNLALMGLGFFIVTKVQGSGKK